MALRSEERKKHFTRQVTYRHGWWFPPEVVRNFQVASTGGTAGNWRPRVRQGCVPCWIPNPQAWMDCKRDIGGGPRRAGCPFASNTAALLPAPRKVRFPDPPRRQSSLARFEPMASQAAPPLDRPALHKVCRFAGPVLEVVILDRHSTRGREQHMAAPLIRPCWAPGPGKPPQPIG